MNADFVVTFDEAIKNEDFDSASLLVINDLGIDNRYLELFSGMLKHVFLIGNISALKEAITE